MDLPHNADLLSHLLQEIDRWLSQFEPLPQAQEEWFSLLRAWSEKPGRRASLEGTMDFAFRTYRERHFAATMPLDAFSDYIDACYFEIYNDLRAVDLGSLPDGISSLDWAEGWPLAIEQVILGVRLLRREVLTKIDTLLSSTAADPPRLCGRCEG